VDFVDGHGSADSSQRSKKVCSIASSARARGAQSLEKPMPNGQKPPHSLGLQLEFHDCSRRLVKRLIDHSSKLFGR